MTRSSFDSADIGFDGADAVRRVWGHDYSLWPDPAPGAGGDWLGWLDLPERLNRGDGVPSDDLLGGFSWATSLTVLGMGGSSLTSEVLRFIFPHRAGCARLYVLDTVNPRSVRAHLEEIDLGTALFAVASKSGTTVEPLSLESVFRRCLEDSGVKDVSRHFVGLSDAGTVLAERALSGDFAAYIETPSNVGGRYSALTPFGMFPAALCGMPVDKMIESANGMFNECRGEDVNAGLDLGMFLGKNALDGRDKVMLVISPSLERFGLWLEQLLAESTGKNGNGLVPIVFRPESGGAVVPLADDRQFVVVKLDGEDFPRLLEPRHPCFEITLPDRASIAGEFFRWEFATAVASAMIGVYPFDQPDVESAKNLAREILVSGNSSGSVTPSPLDVALERLLSKSTRGRYLVISAFLPESDRLTDMFGFLCGAISKRTGMATTFGYGPRYLHSTGQLHKGGPDSVMLLAIVQDDSEVDIPVPGADYSLGELSFSQSAGDVQAMRGLGRDAELAIVGEDAIGEVRRLAREILGR